MYQLLTELFPICRSLTGDGVRRALTIIKNKLPELRIKEVPSGTPVFDWVIPEEWEIRSARLYAPDGRVIVDFADHNLHVIGYSSSIDITLPLEELQSHLHSRSDLPNAIPYITSYYKRQWGLCLKHNVREKLRPGMYRVVIDASLKKGSLTYGELIIPGRLEDEVLLSTYICHPSMANDNLSGPVVAVALARWLLQEPRKYTYRILFIPETIGAIAYLSRHHEHMRRVTKAGFVLTCLGDEGGFSYIPSRDGDTYADKAALHVLRHKASDFTRYTYLDRGSDERQYCSPGIDLPVCSITRSKYMEYPEYHTSLDNLDFVTERGLQGGYEMLRSCLEVLEGDMVLARTMLCEPQMGERGMFSLLGRHGTTGAGRDLLNIMAYVDGKMSLLDIAEKVNLDFPTAASLTKILLQTGAAVIAGEK